MKNKNLTVHFCNYVKESDHLTESEKDNLILAFRDQSLATRLLIAREFIRAHETSYCDFLVSDYVRHVFLSLVGSGDGEETFYSNKFKTFANFCKPRLQRALSEIDKLDN